MYVLLTRMCMYITYVSYTHGGQKTLDSLKQTGVLVLVSHYVGAGN